MDSTAQVDTSDPSQPKDDISIASDDKKLSNNDLIVSSDRSTSPHKVIKPNKVYIGGLPDDTREDDLRDCFGVFGVIKTIELKTGYGFVEFDSRQAAEEAVSVYNEGTFLGSVVKVQLSHGGGKTASKLTEPGACFKCGHRGHWARECPNHTLNISQRRSFADRTVSHSYRRSESFSDRHLTDPVPSTRAERDEYYLQGHPRSDNYSGAYGNREREFGHPSSRQHEYMRKNTHTSGTRPFNTTHSAGYPRERSRSPSGYRVSYPSYSSRDYEGRPEQQHPYEPRYNQPRLATREYPSNVSTARHPDAQTTPTRPNRSHSMYANARDPPRVGARHPEYKAYDPYARPPERRRSASPPSLYREEGSSSQRGYLNEYPQGRMQQQQAIVPPVYRNRPPHMNLGNIPVVNRSDRPEGREYRGYRA